MNKASKFILILFVTSFAYLLISPTLKWYFFTEDEDKRISSYSKEALKDHSKKRALDSLVRLKELYQKDPDAQIPDDLKYLIPVAQNNYKIYGKDFPRSLNVKVLRDGFLTDSDIEELSLEIYRYYENIKLNKNRIIQLGLDLSGGMSITISLDYSGLEQRLGRALSSLEREESVERTMQILKERVDTFGLTEPKITRESGGNKIFLDIPGRGTNSALILF